MPVESIHNKRLTVVAVSYFLSTLRTQAVKDEARITEYERLLLELELELSRYTL